MRYGSLFSGIEATAVGLPHWQPTYFAETAPFCSRLLARRYPEVENLGDVTVPRAWPEVDVLVASPPCQSYSINGNQRGLSDDSLALSFVEVLRQTQPKAFIFENVPNILRTNCGRDWGTILRAVVECGYGVAWRVLDVRSFGVPQRRRRLFAVGILDNESAANVLFDPEADKPVGRASRRQRPKVFGWTGDQTPKVGTEVMPTLRASQGGEGVGIFWSGGCRRLTIDEWERLMGFPVGYTACGTLSERRHALGNAFAPPILAWIGERLEAHLKIKPAAPAAVEAPSQIIAIQRINAQLAVITDAAEALKIRSKAEALRVYYQQASACEDTIRMATACRIRCEKRIGEILLKSVKRGNPKVTRPDHCLKSLGISKNQSSSWQALAAVEEPRLEAYLSSSPKISTVGAIKLVKQPTMESVEVLAGDHEGEAIQGVSTAR